MASFFKKNLWIILLGLLIGSVLFSTDTAAHQLTSPSSPVLELKPVSTVPVSLLAAQSPHSITQLKNFPTDTGMINVKTVYQAKGDGVRDDTASIQAAIAATVGTHATLYFPPGVYLVSQRLDFKNAAGEWRSYLTLQGAGVGRTTIKLKSGVTGFNNPGQPQAVLRPGSKTDDPACSNYAQNNGDGGGNCAFGNYIFDLSVNVGSNNLGAVGVDFTASNYGAMENVVITSDDGGGATGLNLTRSVGPCLIKNVSITGFDKGIYASGELYGITFEYITLAGQRSAGLYNADNALHIRKLSSTNTVPAIVNTGIGLVTILDSSFGGGTPSNSAINNTGTLFARNLSSTGYRSVIAAGTTPVAGTSVDEYTSSPVKNLFAAPQLSLNLPIVETPDFVDNDLTNWANIETYGATKNDGQDDSAALQAAIDSGKDTIYLPWGNYTVNQTVIVRGNVKRIMGFSSSIGGSATPFFRVEGLTGGEVSFEDFDGLHAGVQHASDQAVVIKHFSNGVLTSTSTGSGGWFLEDYCCNTLTLNSNHPLWARQLNVEDSTEPLITNDGGRAWILGLKTEGTKTNIRTINRGQTELLGGILYSLGGSGNPSFINEDASVSLTFTEVSYSDSLDAKTYVQETQAGQTHTLPRTEGVYHGYGGMIPLYVGYNAQWVTQPTDSGDTNANGSLSRALQTTQSGQFIVIALPTGQTTISASGVLPPMANGVKLVNVNGCSSPHVAIDGNGTDNVGVVLKGSNELTGVKVERFVQKQIEIQGLNNRIRCSAFSKS